MGCRKASPLRNTEYSCPGCTPLFAVRSMKSRAPSAATTRPSAGGKAPTTSWIRRPKVAPTWSAVPAPAGGATSKSSAMRRATPPLTPALSPEGRGSLEPLLEPSPLGGEGRVRGLLEHDGRLMNTEDLSQGVADLAKRHLRAHRGQDMGQQVVAAPRGPIHRLERAGGGGAVTRAAQDREALGQGLAHRGVHLEEVGGRRLVHDELVHADHHALLGFHLLLIAVGRLLDLALHERDGVHRPAQA